MRPNNRISHNLFRTLEYVKECRWRLAAIVLLSILTSFLAALSPWPLKLLVDYGFAGSEPPLLLSRFVTALPLPQGQIGISIVAAVSSLLVFGMNAGVEFTLSWNWAIAGQRMVRRVAADLFSRLQRLSLSFHQNSPVGDSLSRVSTDSWCIFNIVQSIFTSPVQSILTLITVGIVAWRLDSGLTLIILVTAPALTLSAVYFSKRLKQRAMLDRQSQANVMSFVHQTLTSLPVVQAFGTEKENRQRFEGLAREAVSRLQRNKVLQQAFALTNGLILAAGAAIVIYAGGQRVILGTLSLGSLLVFIAYMKTMQGAVGTLLNAYGNIKSWEASWERVLEVLDSSEEVEDSPGAKELCRLVPGKSGALRLDRVTFGYEPDRAVLHEIDLSVGVGETLALVGPTGAGKSTLVSLLPRFFDPWSGRVLLDGQDIRDVRLASLRAQISLVLQEPFLLPLTIAENIAYSRPDATLEEVQAAAVAARAHDFIKDLPQGYATPIGERGATLSGGQRQRLSIARALLRNAPILILDEPTSALDAETESLLLSALQSLVRGRTTIIIAHRLSTIRNADRIAFLKDGRIVEHGAHDALIKANGNYARYYDMQFGGQRLEALP